jgi:hypothetical protein
VIRGQEILAILELLVIESLLNVPVDSPPKNAHGPRFRVMDALPGSPRSIQLHERVLHQIFRKIVFSDRPDRIPHKLCVTAIKECSHQFGRLNFVHTSLAGRQKQLTM